MTRTDIEALYTVQNGQITSPGKFEGEAIYVPHFWEAFLMGFSDRDDGDRVGFKLTADDHKDWPELGKHRRWLWLYQRDDGFVCEV